jgi:hypothetical protein
MLSVLIQGPKQPDNDIDVYERPLVDELLFLWKDNGGCVWDDSKRASSYEHCCSVPSMIWHALCNLSRTQARDIGPTPTVYIKQEVFISKIVRRSCMWVTVAFFLRSTS